MKTAKLISVVVIAIAMALALTIAFCGVAVASQPVCPTPETEGIKTVTQISCQGMVTEEERVIWESSNEDLISNPPLGGNETVGMLNYMQDLKVTDGTTNFIKDMDVDTGAAPNLNVMKSMGYSQGTTIGSLSHDEGVSMSLVSNCTATSGVVPCPFAAAAVEVLPASCEDVTASSKMVVTDVLATTITKVEMSDAPVGLHYAITATGSGGAGTNAHGNIVAEFSVYTEEGSDDCWVPGTPGTGHCAGDGASCTDITDPVDCEEHCGCTWNPKTGECVGPGTDCSQFTDPTDCERCGCTWTGTQGTEGHCKYPLGSKLTHYEKSTANGFWEFSKEMDYKSTIRP